MYSTAARTSPSVAAAAPPFGGMAPLPLIALAVSASTPAEARAAQAALSPNFGAPATPAAWQAAQEASYSLRPVAASALPGAAAATATAAAGAAAAGAACLPA